MAGLAIVFLPDKNSVDNKKCSVLKLLISKLKDIFILLKNIIKQQKPKHNLVKIEINDEPDIYKIELPYTEEVLFKDGLRSIYKVQKLLREITEQYGLEDFIFPIKLKEYFKAQSNNNYSGLLLYKALIINILDEVYSNKGIKISELDIAIVNGENQKELHYIIEKISSIAKYITVIGENKEEINAELETLFNDTGLSIRVTDDFKSGLKYADCIINLGGLKELIINAFIKNKALIINYGQLNKNKILVSNSLINGIDIALPKKIQNLFGEIKLKGYNQLEIAETILTLKSKSRNNKLSELDDYSLIDIMGREFKLDGYSIINFVGRNGITDIKM